MEREQSQFDAAGVQAIAIGMGQPGDAQSFCRARAPHVTCLADPSKAAYAAYGLTRGKVLEVMGPEAAVSAARAALKGFRPGMPVGDPWMMPGTFAIDTEGIVRAVHYARHSGEHPDLTRMRAAVGRL